MRWLLGSGFWTIIIAAGAGWVLWTAGIIWWAWGRGQDRGHEAGYDEGFADALSHAREAGPKLAGTDPYGNSYAPTMTVWQRAQLLASLEPVPELPVLETAGPVWAFEPWTGAGLGPVTFEEEIAAMISNADAAYQRLLERQP